MRAERGFTLTELMVVVAILSIISVLAVPHLGRSRQSSAALDWGRSITRQLEVARVRAVSTRRPYVVTLAPDRLTVSWLDPSGAATVESTQQAPSQGLLWSVATTAGAPSTMPVPPYSAHTIQFNPDFTLFVDGDTTKLNAWLYVASTTGNGQGRQALIRVVGTGAIRMGDQW